MRPPATWWGIVAEFAWGKQRLAFEAAGRDVVLCMDQDQALRAARAIAAAFGARVINGSDDVRGTLRDAFGKASAERVRAVLAALGFDEDALEWKLKQLSPMRRLLAGAAASVVSGASALVFELGSFTAMPFDLAHVYRHIHVLHTTFDIPCIVVIVDPALISSSGSQLTVLSDEGVVERAPVADALRNPQSELLLMRLEATPVPNPLAMQQRRVQRAATRPVNYANTQIVQLPTTDAIALAGGDLSD